jgi:hypothetical protein
MIVAALQALAAVAAGVALFRLRRSAMPQQVWLQRVVAAAFIGRALVGQALFWISWAHLPVLGGMQIGDGLWFFGVDGGLYFGHAAAASSQGLVAIAQLPRTLASVAYIQVLALMTWLFGSVTSVALLLNLFCYLAMVALLVRWSRLEPGAQTGAAVAIAAISVSPAFALWSLQPLKDTFFQLLVVAFVCACAAWQRAWMRPSTWWVRALIAVLLAVLMGALSGIRWYFALALLVATLLFLFLTALRSRERKIVSLAAAALVALLLARGVLLGALPQMPKSIVALLTPSTAFGAMRHLPSLLSADIVAVRTDSERTGGSTIIQAGRRTYTPKPRRPTPMRPLASSTSALTPAGRPAQIAEIRLLLSRMLESWNRGDVDAVVDTFDPSNDIELSSGTGPRIATGRQQVRDSFRALAVAADGEVVGFSDMRIDPSADGTATAVGRWNKRRLGRESSGGVGFLLRRRDDGWRIMRLVTTLGDTPPPTAAAVRGHEPLASSSGGVVAPPSGAAIAPPSTSEPAFTIEVPVTAAPRPRPDRGGRMVRIVIGAAAVVLPRSIAEPLGLFHVGGGRGMLWLTEVDTLVFDLTLIIAVAMIARSFAASRRDPLVWMLVALTVLIGGALAYTIANFGTLFRLREMVYIGIILLPVAAAGAAARSAGVDERR